MSDYAFCFRNVNKRHHGFLRDVSFALPTGTIMALVGPNGAGKTTAIRTLVGIADFDGGELTMFDRDVRENDTEVKERLSVVLDEIPYGDSYNAAQIGYILSGLYSSWDGERFQQYLQHFHLIPTQKIKEYSKGMTQKLQLACALSHDAKLLVLDEPLSNLDPASKEDIMNCIMQYMQPGDRSVLITTNTPADIESYVDCVTMLMSGSVVLTGERDRIMERHGLLHCSDEDASKIDKSYIVALRRNRYGSEVLVKNRADFIAQYPSLVPDPVTLDTLLIFYSLRDSEVTL